MRQSSIINCIDSSIELWIKIYLSNNYFNEIRQFIILLQHFTNEDKLILLKFIIICF